MANLAGVCLFFCGGQFVSAAGQAMSRNAVGLPNKIGTDVFDRLVQSAFSSTRSHCPTELAPAIDAILDHPERQRSRWGISIQVLGDGRNLILYQRAAQQYFIPASSVKLMVTAAALQHFGPKFRIRTAIYGPAEATSTSVSLVLRLRGRGDPSLTADDLRTLAQQLHQDGIRQVRLLQIENTFFSGSALNPSWEWGDLPFAYAPPVTSLILNQNATQLTLQPQQIGEPLRPIWADAIAANQWQLDNQTTTARPGTPAQIQIDQTFDRSMLHLQGQLPVDGKSRSVNLAIPDPDRYFVQQMRAALIAEQIKVGRIQIARRQKDSELELAAVESPPLAQLIAETNQSSNNLYAETLLRLLGASFPTSEREATPSRSTPSRSTAQQGMAAIATILTDLGVDAAGYRLADGSGLSRHNLVSPEALVQTLQVMARSPYAAVYRDSLAQAGISGTLRHRFRDTAAAGILQGKTGTLSGTVALSGYLTPPQYKPLAFSLMVNQSDRSPQELRQAMDEVVLLLTRLQPCRKPSN